MKAIYQQPVADFITLSPYTNMLEGSGGLLGTGENPNDLDLNDAATTDATGGNLSRRMSAWDDEDGEEF